jgi:hypothetical protein
MCSFAAEISILALQNRYYLSFFQTIFHHVGTRSIDIFLPRSDHSDVTLLYDTEGNLCQSSSAPRSRPLNGSTSLCLLLSEAFFNLMCRSSIQIYYSSNCYAYRLAIHAIHTKNHNYTVLACSSTSTHATRLRRTKPFAWERRHIPSNHAHAGSFHSDPKARPEDFLWSLTHLEFSQMTV